jgi:hypothetical protein
MKRVFTLIAIAASIALIMSSCTSNPQAPVTTVKYEDTAGFAQFQAWKAMNERVDPTVVTTTAPVKKTVVRRSTSSNNGTMSSSTSNTAKVKKGWSKSAKFATIGAAVGGTAGAIINKKDRVKGALIGILLGGGGGYAIGRGQDKKDGRY